MKKTIQLILLGLLILPTISIAMESPGSLPVRVGDFLRTEQPPFGFHVGVVLWASQSATTDSLDEVLLADHASRHSEQGPEGVRLVWLRDFKVNNISHSPVISEHEKSQAYLIVARAISAHFADPAPIYDIAQKNCGGFAEWCTIRL